MRVRGQGHAGSELVQLVNWLKIVFHLHTCSTVQVLPLALCGCVGFQTELVQHVCAAHCISDDMPYKLLLFKIEVKCLNVFFFSKLF